MGTYLNRTPSSAGNEKTWTVSFWVKRAGISSTSSQFLFASDTNYSDYVWCRFCGTEVTGKADMLQVFMVEPNARESNVRTNRLFRDPSSWYHIVIRCDTTQSTAADRLRIYVNGVEQTSFDTASYLNQNDDNMNWNSNVPQIIGAQLSGGTSERFQNGYITNFVNIDGQSLAPTSFGETDSTTGEWKPKADLSGLTFGTNGFWQKYESAGNLGLDSSGNSNTYTVNNAGTGAQTVDTASNNFCTLNPLQQTTSVTLSNGNLVATNTANDQGAAGTMAFSAGKWYWEVKLVNKVEVGINLDSNILQLSNDSTLSSNDSNLKQTALVTNSAGGPNDFRFNGSTETVNSTACSDGDILMVAVDADNTKIYYGKNGTWMNSGNPAGGSGELKNFSSGYTAGNFITPTFQNGIGTTASCQFNFGNPPFSISSGNADANGFGNFEYAVPSGYYALCTKNLAEYG